ncbi:MAG TPA: RpiB/LacA/LacB family sugar-phosphate isomerase [Acidimicrobiales bacterium]|nr:RpiB/LacA/LacB family sugar-phosphate isomerase [Acidimicrobiales bacterium]
MRVAFGTDEMTPVTEELRADLVNLGHDLVVVANPLRWAEAGMAVGQAVAQGRAEVGVVFCFTGTGVAMAANKVPGVRAALCADPETARGARRWNDANVLALSLRLTTTELGHEMIDAFLSSAPDGTEADQIALLS